MTDIEKRALTWLFHSGDTGMSSEAICCHMLGIGRHHYNCHPSDPADLGRCLRLLEIVPEWKSRMPEMAQYGKGWAGIVAVWPELEGLMRQEVGIDWSKGGPADATYSAMKRALGQKL
jgi:hypothetical protein